MSDPTKDVYDGMNYRQLQEECRAAKLSLRGNQHLIRKRLRAWTSDSSKRQKGNPADDLICPITRAFPWNPKTAEDGRVYDGEAIDKWISMHPGATLKSPVTGNQMGKRTTLAVQHKNTIQCLIDNGMVEGDLVKKWNEKAKEEKKAKAEERKARAKVVAARKQLRQKAMEGDAISMFNMASLMQAGKGGFKKDVDEAVKWYKRAHCCGSVEGTALYASALCYGWGKLPQDHKRGLMYLGIAAGRGSDYAALELAHALMYNKFGAKAEDTSPQEIMKWLEQAAGTIEAGTCRFMHLLASAKEAAKSKIPQLRHEAWNWNYSV